MAKYVLKRLGFAVLVIWVVVTLTFVLMHTLPGNPFESAGKRMPDSVLQNLKRYYNLDKPVIIQYWSYIKSILRLDLGPSMKSSSMTVNDYIKKGFPVSAHLGLQAFLIALALGLVLGVVSALWHNRWPDHITMILSAIGMSVPGFVIATLLINYLGVKWNLFPIALWRSWRHTIMPSLSLAFLPMSYIARLMRSSMLEVLSQDYIKTARAKGLSNGAVIIRHAATNAILPVISVLGLILTGLVTGSFVIEKIFSIPGMGDMFVKGVLNRDYPVVLGSTLFYCTLLTIINLITDIAYKIIDPRIKLTAD